MIAVVVRYAFSIGEFGMLGFGTAATGMLVDHKNFYIGTATVIRFVSSCFGVQQID